MLYQVAVANHLGKRINTIMTCFCYFRHTSQAEAIEAIKRCPAKTYGKKKSQSICNPEYSRRSMRPSPICMNSPCLRQVRHWKSLYTLPATRTTLWRNAARLRRQVTREIIAPGAEIPFPSASCLADGTYRWHPAYENRNFGLEILV